MVSASPDTARTTGRYRALSRSAAAVVGCLGAVTLVGWAAGHATIGTLAPDLVPMAPSTAAMFVVFAVAVFLRGQWPATVGAIRAGVALVSASALGALLLFVLSGRGVYLEAEHLGALFHAPGAVPAGHMSPVTALCFVLAAASFLASWRAAAGQQRWAAPAWWLSATLLAAGITLVLAYLYGEPFLTGTQVIPPASLTSLCFVGLAVALLGLAGPHAQRGQAGTSREGVLVFGAVSMLIIAVGYLSYTQYKRQYLHEVRRQLLVITELKSGELLQFRRERLGDAELLFQNSEFTQVLRSFLAAPGSPEAQTQLEAWLRAVAAHHDYDRIFVHDREGVLRSVYPPETATNGTTTDFVLSVLKTRHVALRDFYRDESDARVYAAVVVPIIDASGQALGSVTMRLDPEHYLYPFIKRWPTDSASGETLLVRREGDEVVFLNELRFGGNGALMLRLPLTKTEVLGVKAALGEEGLLEGLDYRGVPVMGAAKRVPDSPWILVARVDKAEVYAPLRSRLWLVAMLTGSLLLGGWMALSWWQQRVRSFTDRIAFNETLQKTNEELARIYDTAHFCLVSLDREFNFIRVNRAYAEVCGAPADSFPGKNHFALFPHAENQAIFQRVVDTGQPFTIFAKPFTFPDHPERTTYWDWTLHPLKDWSGRVEGLLFVLLDVTERRKSEDALRRSEQTLNEAQHRAHLGNWEIDYAGGESHWSDETFSILELDPRTTRPGIDTFTSVIHPDDRDFVLGAFEQSIRRGEPYELVHRLLLKDGRVKYVNEQGETSCDAGGKPLRSVGTIQDITERTKLEEQLRQAQKMESIGQLAGGVAHDFNNMLTAILGYGTLVKMGLGAGHPLQSDVEEIIAAANRAAQLTHSLLAFSRKQIMNLKPVDVNDVITRMAKLLTRVIGEEIQLETHLAPEPLRAVADAGQLEQVLVNLATNARDAMPKGGRLTIRSEASTLDESYVRAQGHGKAGRYAMVTVSDTGAGMDTETRAKIFEPFFTTKEVGKGTGLGLAMVYGTVKQHDGFIHVYSEPGQGTTFKVYLPLMEGKGEAVEAKPEPPLTGGRETILVAEDDPALRRLAASVLGEFGYTVILAEDGEDAVAKFKAHASEIRLVLLDVIMPKKNGKDAWDEIHKLSPAMKAIFVSGYTADAVQSKEIAAEGLDFVPKPVSPASLLRRVREVLDRV